MDLTGCAVKGGERRKRKGVILKVVMLRKRSKVTRRSDSIQPQDRRTWYVQHVPKLRSVSIRTLMSLDFADDYSYTQLKPHAK